MITGTWKSPALDLKNYENFLVAALTNNTVGKSAVENNLAEMLGKYQIAASKGIDVFTPEASNSDSDLVRIQNNVHSEGFDAILAVSLLKKETESRYVRDRYALYDPFHYDHYQSFGGYYSYWYPYTYNPDYYTEKVYYIETNLYDAKTEKLVWSAQSKTYYMDDLSSFSKGFAKSIVAQLRKDGIINENSQSNNK